MIVAALTAEVFGTNCYVVAPGQGGPCVVVDPGAGIADQLPELLAEHELRPAAVLLTHGHFDHTFSAADICQMWDVPVYVHPGDRAQLDDPATGIGVDPQLMLGEGFIYRVPRPVLPYPDSGHLSVAGLEVLITPAPGHTPGCVLLTVSVPAGDDSVCLTGDVLFAGSVGRTDLPGGDPDTMRDTLSRVVGALPDPIPVLPGHGPTTTVGRERASNPFLRDALSTAVGASEDF